MQFLILESEIMQNILLPSNHIIILCLPFSLDRLTVSVIFRWEIPSLYQPLDL